MSEEEQESEPLSEPSEPTKLPQLRTEEEKVLQVVKWFHDHKDEDQRGVISRICRELAVSGRTVGRARRYLNDGLVQFNEQGEPYYTVDFTQKNTRIAMDERATERAQKTVIDGVVGAIADETATITKQYYVLGKAVWQGMMQWASRHGYTPQQLAKMSVHEIVLDALEKRDRYPEILEENKQLQNTVTFLKGETDPMVRLKASCSLIIEFTKAISLAELAGFNVETSGLIEHYQNMLNNYMRGQK